MSFWAAMDSPNIILLIRAINRMRIMILIKVNRLIHVQIQAVLDQVPSNAQIPAEIRVPDQIPTNAQIIAETRVPDQIPTNAQIPAEIRVPDQIPTNDQIPAEIRVPDQIPTNDQITAETHILVLIINFLFLLGLLCATDA
jgi:hypothetical protein